MSEAAVLAWVGDADLYSMVDLGAEIDRMVADPGVDALTIDLAAVGFIDSVGLGVLVHARNCALERGVPLTLRSATRKTRRLLEVTGLGGLFTFEDVHPTTPADVADLPRSVSEQAAPDPRFDRVAALAARLLTAPTALVTFVDQGGQVMPGSVGMPDPWQDTRSMPLAYSTCQYVVARGAPLVIADMRVDPLFADSPAVRELGVLAYAGMPLTDLTGRVVGSLCAIDTRAREWTQADLDNLRDLADICSTEVKLRSAARRSTLSAERERVAHELQTQVATHLLTLTHTLAGVRTMTDGPIGDRVTAAIVQADLALSALRTSAFGRPHESTPPATAAERD